MQSCGTVSPWGLPPATFQGLTVWWRGLAGWGHGQHSGPLPDLSLQGSPSMQKALAPPRAVSMQRLSPQDPRGLPQAHQPPHLHQPHPRLHHAE